MDLVITTTTGRHHDVRLKYCLRGIANLKYDHLYIVGDLPHNTDVTDFTHVQQDGTEMEMVRAVSERHDLSEEFILIPDNCFLVGAFPPGRYANAVRLQRRHDSVEQMVKTIKHLQAGDRPVFDYEVRVPQIFGKRNVVALWEEIGGYRDKDFCFRSLYCNTYPEPHIRVINMEVEAWSHYDDPRDSALVLHDLALEHKRCRIWLSHKLEKPSAHERPELVRNTG